MNEEQARDWLTSKLHVSRETSERLETLLRLVIEENRRQNLISEGSICQAWARHIVDSAQLMRFATSGSSWIDLGTGAGFPGLVVALLHEGKVDLIEERRLRADFLERAAQELGVAEKTNVHCSKLERLTPTAYDIISARAFAPLEKLLTISHPFSHSNTRWILPKGRNARIELEAVKSSWQGDFRLEPSVTDEDAGIIVANAVQPLEKGRGGQ